MNKYSIAFLMGFTLVVSMTGTVFAGISYSITNLGGNDWQYDWVLDNDWGVGEVTSFTIFFPAGNAITDNGHAANWNVVTYDPYLLFGNPIDGVYDALTDVGLGLAEGGSLSGFSSRFSWTGIGSPGSQYYTIGDLSDPSNYVELANGWTEPITPPNGIPAPAALPLALLGMATLRAVRFGRR